MFEEEEEGDNCILISSVKGVGLLLELLIEHKNGLRGCRQEALRGGENFDKKAEGGSGEGILMNKHTHNKGGGEVHV